MSLLLQICPTLVHKGLIK